MGGLPCNFLGLNDVWPVWLFGVFWLSMCFVQCSCCLGGSHRFFGFGGSLYFVLFPWLMWWGVLLDFGCWGVVDCGILGDWRVDII